MVWDTDGMGREMYGRDTEWHGGPNTIASTFGEEFIWEFGRLTGTTKLNSANILSKCHCYLVGVVC